MEEQYLTEDEVEELYGIKPSTLQALRERGIGPRTVERDGKLVYPVTDLEEWLSER